MKGQKFMVEMSADGVAYTKVGKLTEVDLTRSRATVETNNFDSPDWVERISTIRDWGLEWDSIWLHTDAGQVIIEAAYDSDDPYYFRFTEVDETAGYPEWIGQGFVTEIGIPATMNEVVTMPVSVEAASELTKTTLV